MDPRRVVPQDYGRRGGAYGSARAIAPTAMPSLSTGQSFYTVESLQGATVVPPPQPAPPPPRLLPPEPYPHDAHPRLPRRPDPAEHGDFGAPMRYPPSPPLGRKMMMPPPDLRFPRHREGPGMMHRRPPPFMPESRVPGVLPRPRDIPPPRGGWGPYTDSRPHWSDHGRDRSRSFQRFNARKPTQKTVKPVSQAKTTDKAAADKKLSVHKHNLGKGKGNKKEVESQKQGEDTAEKIADIKDDAIDEANAEKGAKSEDKIAKITPSHEDKSNPKDSARTPQPFTAKPGKKREAKGAATQQPKKSHKSAATQNDIPVKSNNESETAQATCAEVMPDADPKGADDDASLQKSADIMSEQMLPAVEPEKEGNLKGIEADGKGDAGFSYGIVGQSAEVQ